MQFEAPEFDEKRNPNTPHDLNHFKELRSLAGYIAATAAAIWLVIELLVYSVPFWITLPREQRLFGAVSQELLKSSASPPELQTLADDLAKHMHLPRGSVRVFVHEDETMNAYATFGGNIILLRGLLDAMPSEQAVAAVVAHEIAHIKHRDLLRSASRSLLSQIVWTSLIGADSASITGTVLNLEGLRHSRKRENAADEAAVHALAAKYGDVSGAIATFERFQQYEQEKKKGDTITWLSSHPATADRLTHIRAIAAKSHYSLDATKQTPNPFASTPAQKPQEPQNKQAQPSP